MKVQGIKREIVDVEVDPLDVIDTLFLTYFNHRPEQLVIKEDKCLYFEYDISEHGSPMMRYELITNKKDLIKIYQHLIELKRLMLNDKHFEL